MNEDHQFLNLKLMRVRVDERMKDGWRRHLDLDQIEVEKQMR